MNTKLLMSASAIVMILAGVALSFMPDEFAGYLSLTAPSSIEKLILQLLGALYFASGMINWTARANLIGGIYSRPVAIGNLVHFFVGALPLIKGYLANRETVVLIAAIFYSVFAVCFTYVFFTHPLPRTTTDNP